LACQNDLEEIHRFAHGMFRNAVITGACGGLGQALARQLIAQGAHVALVGMNTDTLHALAALVKATGHARSGDRQRGRGRWL
jgi:NADP-dependent 3-hydroxy acid dehydrogenase YdfG